MQDLKTTPPLRSFAAITCSLADLVVPAQGDPEGPRRTTTREQNPWFLGFEAAILIVGTMIRSGFKALNRFPFCRPAEAAIFLLALGATPSAANKPCRSVYSCA